MGIEELTMVAMLDSRGSSSRGKTRRGGRYVYCY